MTEKDKKADLCLLDEDDEFEEFSAEDWADDNFEEDDTDGVNVWEDNWDDDNVEDDFNQQLAAYLEKHKSTAPTKMSS